MKRLLFASLLMTPFLATETMAQNDQGKSNVLFEETDVHITRPELRVFVTPQIADLELIYPGRPREEYQQFFDIKSIDSLSEKEYDNYKTRALYYFAMEHNADIIIEPMFDCRVSESNPKRLLINITGYPARYVNFRPLGKDDKDIEMVKVVYPAEFQKVDK